MASPEAKYRMLEREARRLRIIAEAVGTPEEIERFEQTRNQPTFGDPEMARIFTERAVADLLQSANGIEIEEDDLTEDAQIKKFNASTGEMEDFQTTAEKLSAAEAEQGQPLQETDSSEASGVNATDAAKDKADELGVDLSTVEGTGQDGKITVPDVEKAAQGT